MNAKVRKKIDELMAGMRCPKDFKCAKNGFERLCTAGDFGAETYLECLDLESADCHFALPFGGGRLCECPLRVYLFKKLRR